MTVTLFDDLDAVAAAAGDSLDRTAQPRLGDRLDWFAATLAHCPPPGRPLVVRAGDARSSTWLFLMLDRSVARPLASWYTLAFDPVTTGTPTDAHLDAIAATLRRRRLSRVELAPLNGDPEPLVRAFRGAGWWTRLDVATRAWSVEVAPGDWDRYWAARPARLRATVRRKTRDDLVLSILDRFDPAAWSDYQRVYAASWKPGEGAPGFLRDLARREGAAGTLRLGLARLDGRPIAAQLWLVERGIATIHKLAHDRDADRLSPGTLLTAAMMRSAIERDRVARIAFGLGDDPYKADWMDDRRPVHRLRAFDPASPRGLLAAGRALVGAALRR